jgi:hypothetical protein
MKLIDSNASLMGVFLETVYTPLIGSSLDETRCTLFKKNKTL